MFWLSFFLVDRLTFLVINSKKIATIPFSEIVATFYKAIPLDLSMTAYIVVIPMLSFFYWLFDGRRTVELKWLSTYNKVLIVLFSTISAANFNIYREWGSKINSKALGFAISTPNEALASSASAPIVLTLSILLLLILIGFVLQHYVVERNLSINTRNIWVKIAFVPVLLTTNFLLIRGGLGGSPINQSMSYFSKEQVLNHAAVNTEWNLLSSCLAARKTSSNPYLYFSSKQANEDVKDLYKQSKDTTIKVLKMDRPNVVLFIIESFTADLTQTLGNEVGITPNFDALIEKGILFSNIYASGSRTDKGLVATLAGFPTLAAGSIVKWPEKMQKIPSLSQPLFRNGYSTSFFYGGESEFDNYKAFILSHNYQKLIDKNDFATAGKSPWGQFDEATLQRQLLELNKEKQPFFSTTLTLTNHEPYVLPGRSKFGTEDNKAKFKSTTFYTDSCIRAFLNRASEQPWYKNTLFVFVADHGHLLPKEKYDIFDPGRYHIPLLFFGEVIKDEYKGAKFANVGSQTDLAATLLSQLDISSKEFTWSKNLLNPYSRPFAFFSWDNGMGFINNKQCVTFDNVGKTILYNSNTKDDGETSAILNSAKGYLQNVYQQFIEL